MSDNLKSPLGITSNFEMPAIAADIHRTSARPLAILGNFYRNPRFSGKPFRQSVNKPMGDMLDDQNRNGIIAGNFHHDVAQSRGSPGR